ncbi:MAG: multiheme c-type cytochrome [Planctomycetota bacterium]
MELALTVLAVVAAVALLARTADRRLRGLALLVVLVAAAAAAAQFPRRARAGSEGDPLTQERPVAERNRGYVSSQACKSCHPSQYESWHRSYHRTMTQVVTPETMLADWSGTLEIRGKRYSLSREGDEYWVDQDDPESSGNRTRRVKQRVVLATGAHHQQVFWVPSGEGRRLSLFPATWLVPERRWIPYHNSFLRPDLAVEQNEIWNAVCIKCHATAGRPGRDERTHVLDTKVAEFGIACEACHGPGEEHVRKNRDPLRRYALHLGEGGDDTIVQPEKLPALASAQVCGQCHGVSGLRERSAQLAWWRDGYPYRPGRDLLETREVIRRPKDPRHPFLLDPDLAAGLDQSFWSDGAIRVSGREYNGLVESPCFKGGEFSCLSCHTMHDYSEPDDQLAKNRTGDEACLQCHGKFRGRVEEHTHHPAASSGSRCYNCHMPYTTYGLFKAIRAHKVGSPSVRESAVVHRPNACNLCHLDKTLEWTGQNLEKWYGKPQVRFETKRAAALVWLLEGDAGQRALVAWHMGWEPALEASGRDWVAPFLSYELDDSYGAVRFIAARSLRRLEEFEGFDYDFVAPRESRLVRMRVALDLWSRGARPKGRGAELFLRPDGTLDVPAVERAIRARDNRVVDLAE